MSDFSIFGEIGGDASGFINAARKAQEAASVFGEVAGGVFAGMGAASLFEGLVGGLNHIVDTSIATANEFQAWGAVIGNVADDANSAFSDIGDASGKAGAKAAASALEAQDALIKYNEKIQEISQNIADVMKGQNVLDAQAELYSKLNDLAQAHADKVKNLQQSIDQVNQDMANNKADREQSLADNLQDMTDSNEVKKANTAEKRQKEMSLATNSFTKNLLIKKYADEDKLSNDEFQRQYDLKKKQGERNNAEAAARDKRAADTKISKLQEQINQENAMYDQQEKKLEDQSAKRIATLEAENAKKLAKYKQELADEDRAYELSQAKKAASGGGGGGGSSGNIKLDRNVMEAGDSLSKTKSSASELLHYIDKISDTTPFKIGELEQASQQMLMQGVNAKAMLPAIQNISGFFQKSPSDVTAAVMGAMHGRARQLQTEFGISGQVMENALGRPLKNSNDVLLAISKLAETKFGTGMQTQSDIAGSHMTQLDNQITKITLAIMGIDEATGKPVKGGFFDSMLQVVTELANYLQKHRAEIAKFGQDVVQTFIKLIKGVGEFFSFIVKHKTELAILGAALAGIAVVLGGAFLAAVIAANAAVIAIEATFIIAAAGILLPWIAAGAAIGIIVYAIVTHWNQVVAAFKAAGKFIMDVVKVMVDWITKHFMLVILFLGPAGLIIVGLAEVAKHWDEIWGAISKVIGEIAKAIGDYLGGIVKAIGGAFDKIGNYFKEQGPKWLEWGKNIGKSFIDGIVKALDGAEKILEAPLKAAFNMFKSKSPPTSGPLQEVDEWGYNIGISWAQGFNQAVTKINIPTPNLSSRGMYGLSGGGGGGIGNYNAQQYKTSNVKMENIFNVNSATTANMAAEYMAFQLEHKGLV